MGHGKSGGGSKFAEGSRALGATKIEPMANGDLVQNTRHAYTDWALGLSPQEINHLKQYTYSHHHAINESLRGERPMDPAMQREIDTMQGALLKAKIPEDMVVYRGVDTTISPAEARQQIGKDFINEGFSSTSLDFQTGFQFSGFKDFETPHTVYQFTLPKGLSGGFIDGISGNKGENEMLLPKGARFRVTGVRTIQYGGPFGDEPPEKVIVIKATYLGPK